MRLLDFEITKNIYYNSFYKIDFRFLNLLNGPENHCQIGDSCGGVI